MISALRTNLKPTILLVLSLLLSVFVPSTSGGRAQPPGTTARAEFSADDFDWREMVPYLFAAANLPEEQGIKAMLENSRVLRVYIANEGRARCNEDKNPCDPTGDSSLLDTEVGKRIDEIVHEGISRQHKATIVDYPLARQPFPFSEIAAVKDEKRPDAYFMLQFTDHSYTAWQLQAKYGAPYDTNIFDRYSVFTYRLDTAGYSSRAVFEINPVDGTVMKVTVSLKRKKPKNPY